MGFTGRRTGRPEWATAGELTTVAGRRAHHDLIDERLGEWAAQHTGDDVVETLWPAGVPVAKVMQPHRQTELPQLAARGFFEDVGHPVNDPTPHTALPFRLSPGPQRFHRHPAPLLGQHNDELLTELGLSAAEIAELEADDVIGHAPPSHRPRKVTR